MTYPMEHTRPAVYRQTPFFWTALFMIFLLSVVISTSYRGITHDEGIGGFRWAAERIVANEPLVNDSDVAEGSRALKYPARLIYSLFIALGYKLVGINLLAYHVFPFVFQVVNPLLFFWVVLRFSNRLWWSFGGTILFLFHPFNFVYLNQPHNHPFFVCILLCLVLVFQQALRCPKWLLLSGILSTLLIVTRFEGGCIFVTLLYGLYLFERRSSGIPVKWLFGSIGMLLLVYVIFALSLDFPLQYPIYYLSLVFRRQAEYGSGFSYHELTLRAIRIFMYWFFGGKFFAPLLGGLVILGIVEQFRQRIFFPTALFFPYFFFLVFIYNGRFDATYLAVATFCIPWYVLLLLSGIQMISRFLSRLLKSSFRRGLSYRKVNLNHSLPIFMVFIICVVFGRATYSLMLITEDAIPASTLWRIIRANPPMPRNPLYQETRIPLSQHEEYEIELREELIKAVRGRYRSWYIHKIGQYAFKHGFPEKARGNTDFVYVDDFESPEKWETDRSSIASSSPLWSQRYAGRLGAFPYGKEGFFIYKFDFAKPIESVTISDLHTQWGIGDVTKMWTSTDGEHWTLRYHNWNVHYTEDPYYQFFPDEFKGYSTLYIKYFFHAGDKTRTGNDNRGASLEEFSLAVNYSNPQ